MLGGRRDLRGAARLVVRRQRDPCLNTVYPPNAWFYTYWGGIGTSGHYLEERAHVTNCVFHVGDWKEFYPDVKIWIRADGSYTSCDEQLTG